MKLPSSESEGVSPAIGVILLVALTVVFAAVVVAVGMGLAGGSLSAKSVGMVLDTYSVPVGISGEPEHGVTVTVMNGKDARDIAEMHVYMDTPELYYLKQGNTNVTFPVTGVQYHYFADAGTYMKLYGDTWVRTNKLNNTGALENKLVTVVGKFTDGAEQVLLQKLVTIPAMIGVNQQFNYTYVSVQTFTNTTGIPGHGLMVSLINDAAKSVNSVELKVQNPDGKDLPTQYSTLENRPKSGDVYFFYLDAGKEVTTSPYYAFHYSPADPTEQLIGTAEIFVTLKNGSQVTETVPVNIPARINIFENSSIAAATLEPVTTTGKIANLTFSKVPQSTKIVYGLRDAHLELGSITSSIQENTIYELGNKDKGTIKFLQQHSTDTLEAYVRVAMGTSVWYRVATIPVAELIKDREKN